MTTTGRPGVPTDDVRTSADQAADDFLMAEDDDRPKAVNGHKRAPGGPARPYGSAALVYAQKGHTGVIPLVRSTKLPALKNVTGREGRQTTPEEYADPELISKYAVYNIAWRLPPGYMALDVDHGYGGKTGADTLADLELTLGPLPATWSSTARGDGPSRIMFFKIPRDAGELEVSAGNDIDVIQHHHRYAVVGPSVHPKTGTKYKWYPPAGSDTKGPPGPDDLPYLPDAWLKHLSKEQRDHIPGAGRSVDEFEDLYTEESDPDLVSRIRMRFRPDEGSRHDTMMKALGWAARAAVDGKVAAAGIFEALEEDWFQAAGAEREDEFRELLSTAVRDAPDPDPAKSVQSRAEAMLTAFLDCDTLRQLPAPDYLIKGWLTSGMGNRINGEPGSGKSLVALDWAGCIGTGTAWHGHEVKQGTVLYVVGEGVEGVAKRQVVWEKHYGKRMAGVMFYPKPIQILERREGDLRGSAEWDTFSEVCRRVRPTLIILDTQRRVTAAAEENSNSDLQKAVNCLDDLREELRMAWLLVHHTPKGGTGGAGGGAVWGSVNSEFEMGKQGRGLDAVFKLTNTKEKDEEDGTEVTMTLERFETDRDAGVIDPFNESTPETSVVLVLDTGEIERDTMAERLEISEDMPQTQQDLLRVLREIWGEGTQFTKAEAKTMAVKIMSKGSFYNAWAALIASNGISPAMLDNGNPSTVRFTV
jgi:hypothetical protein